MGDICTIASMDTQANSGGPVIYKGPRICKIIRKFRWGEPTLHFVVGDLNLYYLFYKTFVSRALFIYYSDRHHLKEVITLHHSFVHNWFYSLAFSRWVYDILLLRYVMVLCHYYRYYSNLKYLCELRGIDTLFHRLKFSELNVPQLNDLHVISSSYNT